VNTKLQDIFEEGIWGEILIRSPSLMTSYFKNFEATSSTVLDGWLHTGDIGYQKERKWYIVDRAKVSHSSLTANSTHIIQELIKVRGWQVSPTEIEACLLTHPAVLDVAVIGIDFRDGQGELPRAYVVLNPEMANSVADVEIQDHLNDRLAKYKALTGGVRRVRDIPRSPSGKILKRLIREQARKEVGNSLKTQGFVISETPTIAESPDELR